MNAQEGQEKFKQADRLYREGQYQDALDLLSELNRAYPNAKNVLYPAALCLEKLGRPNEALPLCQQLIRQYQDPRAEKLLARLEEQIGQSGAGGLLDLDMPGQNRALTDDLLDFGPPVAGDALGLPGTPLTYKPVEPEPFPWLKYSLIGLGVLAVAALIIVPILTYEPPPPGSEPVAEGERVNTTAIYATTFLAYLIIVGFQSAGAYLCLMLQRALPHEDFWSNFFNISVSMFLATLLEGSIFGIFITGMWFSKAYDLSFGALIVLYIFRIIFGAVGAFIGFAMIFGSVAMVFQQFAPV